MKYLLKTTNGRGGKTMELVKIAENGDTEIFRDIGASTEFVHKPHWIEIKSRNNTVDYFLSQGYIETDSKPWDLLQKIRKKTLKLEKMFTCDVKEAHFKFVDGVFEPMPKTKVVKFNSTKELVDKALKYKRELYQHQKNEFKCINANMLSEAEKKELIVLGFKME